MRSVAFLLVLSLAATAVALVPEASAVGTCTSLTNAVRDPDCPHLFCYGTSWSYPDRYYRCHKYVDIPPPCYCTIEPGWLP